ncbi:MAG: BrnT family toxin, partial [Candidatus Acidiferrales bacterium]
VLTTHPGRVIVCSALGFMRFEWDETKSLRNLRKHDARFETAALVFDDPHALTQRDSASEEEERWVTIGSVGPGSILLVVYTFHKTGGEENIRIIPARAAGSPREEGL